MNIWCSIKTGISIGVSTLSSGTANCLPSISTDRPYLQSCVKQYIQHYTFNWDPPGALSKVSSKAGI